MKHVQACLSAREDRESCFHDCKVPVSLVQAYSCAKRVHNAVLTSEEVLGSTFKCQRRSRKQFSQLWRPCEVGASLFMRGKYMIPPFSITEGVL